MPLDKHPLDGIPRFTVKVLPIVDFEEIVTNAGYARIGKSSASGGRDFVWFTHPTYRRIAAIYEMTTGLVITAYHPD